MGYVIYKICCDDCDEFYLGSTENFTVRKNRHKTECNNPNMTEYDQKIYKVIRANGGWQNWRMVVIEECGEDIKTKRQAEVRREVVWMELKAKLNLNRVYLKREDKKEDNVKEKRVVKCKCGCDVFKSSLYYHLRSKRHLKLMEEKEKEEKEKEEKVKAMKAKDKEEARRKELIHGPVECECGCVIPRGRMDFHLGSRKHMVCLRIKNGEEDPEKKKREIENEIISCGCGCEVRRRNLRVHLHSREHVKRTATRTIKRFLQNRRKN